MVDLNQDIEVQLSPNNIQYYENKGYSINHLKRKTKNNNKLCIPRGTKIKVKLYDVTLYSGAEIVYVCDYCGKEVNKSYYAYNIEKEKSLLKKDCCSDCRGTKITESNKINRISLKEVFNQFQDRDCVLLETEFLDFHQKLHYICNKHKEKGVQKVAYTQFKSGAGCLYCGIERSKEKQTLNFDDIKIAFENSTLILISTTYKNCKDKLQYICSIHPEKGIQKISWSKFNLGHGCYYCGRIKLAKSQSLDFSFVNQQFINCDYTLLTNFYINNGQKLEYICNKHEDKGIQTIDYSRLQSGVRCKYCWDERRRGSGHWNWQGGISELKNFLRGLLTDWKKQSMKNSNYKCILTNKRFDDIHHLYGFDLILKEFIDEYKINIETNVNDYTESELKEIEFNFLKIHNKHPFGVCLTNPIHELFHHEYNFGSNTPEQFTEFQIRYNNGEFSQLQS